MRLTTTSLKTSTGQNRLAALDGYRGLFVILVLLYHFGVTGLVGGWVGINHFFTFSGYLITRLLMSERARYGSIDVLAFYRRRAERLLPALVVVCSVVLVAALAAGSAARNRIAGDVLATLFFVQNWRLVDREDAYFDQVGDPSPLRHAWTLGVEEQFYLLVPLLILAAFAALRTRRARFLLFAALALASAWWTMHLADGGASFARLYYGTDTRAQALLVGAAAAVLLGRDDRGRLGRRPSVAATQVIGAVGVALSLAPFVVVGPSSEWLFTQGGMLLFAVGAVMMGIAATDPRDLPINRPASWPPLVLMGQMTYGLYLYHWPIRLWVGPLVDDLPLVVSVLVLLGLTVAVSYVSFRYLELPVLMRGFGALVPGRERVRRWWAAPLASVLVIALAAWGLWSRPVSEEDLDVPPLVAEQAPWAEPEGDVAVGLLGDSVGASLAAGWQAADYPGVTLVNASRIGCDLIAAPMLLGDSPAPTDGTCDEWRAQWPTTMRDGGVRELVVLAGVQFMGAHEVDGRRVEPHTPEGAELITRTLDEVAVRAEDAGVERVHVVTVPCRQVDATRLDPALQAFAGPVSDPANVGWVNDTVRGWAKGEGPGAQRSLLDLWEPLCGNGFQPEINGVPLYHDTVHLSPSGAAMVWTWLMPRAVARG